MEENNYPIEGQLYFDIDINSIYEFENGKWVFKHCIKSTQMVPHQIMEEITQLVDGLMQ